jgi:hypothetical protein
MDRYGPHRLAELEHDGEIAGALQDFERLGIVDAARRAQRPAFQSRIVGGASREVLFLLRERHVTALL